MKTVGVQVAVLCSVFALLLSLVSIVTNDTGQGVMMSATVTYDTATSDFLLDSTNSVDDSLNVTVDETAGFVVEDTVTETTIKTVIEEDGALLNTSTDIVNVDETGVVSEEQVEDLSTGTQLVDCPFDVKRNRTIVDLTRDGTKAVTELLIVANGSYTDAITSYATHLPAGVYDVHLASYHQPDTSSSLSYEERWFVELYSGTGERVFRSEPTRRTYRDEMYIEETVGSDVAVLDEVEKVVGMHAAYKNSETYTFAPLCIAFDYQAPLPESVADAVENTVTELETNVVSDSVESFDLSTFLTCPLSSKTGRTIVDFTEKETVPIHDHRVSADTSVGVPSSVGPVKTLLQSGVYAVTVASYGNELNDGVSDKQVWYVQLRDENKKVVLDTPRTSDVPDDKNEIYVEKLSSLITVNSPVVYGSALHGIHLLGEPNIVAPVCVAFDLLYAFKEPDVTAVEEGVVSVDASNVVSAVPAVTEESVTTTYNIFTGEEESGSGVTKTSVQVLANDDKLDDEFVMVTYQSAGISSSKEILQLSVQTSFEREKLIEGLEVTLLEKLAEAGEIERKEVIRTYVALTEKDEGKLQEKVEVLTTRESVEAGSGSIEENADFAFEQFRLKERVTLDTVYLDSDGDGVTDYDERYIYKTDAQNPFTGGGTFTDGERILLGLNPKDDSTNPVLVESPKQFGDEVESMYTIDSIELVSEDSGDLASVSPKQLRVKGTAQPSAFVTLYMYSTPIVVTVRTDENGEFQYTFDEVLEDGNHELYVASVNTTGKILAKSKPASFVKTAEAVEYIPVIATSDSNPVDASMQSFVIFILIITMLFVVGAIVWIGGYHSRTDHVEAVTHEQYEGE